MPDVTIGLSVNFSEKYVNVTNSPDLHIITLTAACVYFEHFTYEIAVMLLYIALYWCPPEDGSVSPKRVGGFVLWVFLILSCAFIGIYIYI